MHFRCSRFCTQPIPARMFCFVIVTSQVCFSFLFFAIERLVEDVCKCFRFASPLIPNLFRWFYVEWVCRYGFWFFFIVLCSSHVCIPFGNFDRRIHFIFLQLNKCICIRERTLLAKLLLLPLEMVFICLAFVCQLNLVFCTIYIILSHYSQRWVYVLVLYCYVQYGLFFCLF